ncbi:hypothetical protein FIBSPDRAFT_945329 [Athelia psychrophila]|uniref:t-SNARE coiled-coil homology domain-containing protein n=1 Tax=Athelia psychrophila TaxID=1759441 RepID=A0A166U4Q8_9AGAM|nr:hypothetical protein FIBSPDRAFT_945329 [Fibularhizoctonia sp. CBS 109695]
MSFWKSKDKNLIPPVAPEAPRDYSRSNSYNNAPPPSRPDLNSNYSSASGRGGPPPNNAYGAPPPGGGPPPQNRYGRGLTPRGTDAPDATQNQYGAPQDQYGASQDQYGGAGTQFQRAPRRPEPEAGQEDEEDVEGIKQQTRYVKQDSVNSTRNALRMMREAEETAQKLANTERHLDVSKGHSSRAADKTDELKKLNRSIFRPAITFNKDAKRAAQDAKLQARYDEEQAERETAMGDIRATKDRLGQATNYRHGSGGDDEELLTGPGAPGRQPVQKQRDNRYRFDATASDDELEDELDGNLDEMSSGLKNLKLLSQAMGQELGQQNERIDRIEQKTVTLDDKVLRNTEKLKRIK